MRRLFGTATVAAGRPFVIVFPGRTGSSWLVSALDEHPEIDAAGELLVRRDAAEQVGLIRDALAPRRGRAARGFKTKMKDVADPDALRNAIADAGALVIHMRRDDRLRLAISRINARRLHAATGRWNRQLDRERGRETDAAPVDPIGFDELHEALVASAAEVDRVATFVGSLAGDVVEVRYADILRSPEVVLESVQAAIGVPPRPLRSRVVKNSDEDLRTSIPDFDDLRARFAATPFAVAFDVDPRRES